MKKLKIKIVDTMYFKTNLFFNPQGISTDEKNFNDPLKN